MAKIDNRTPRHVYEELILKSLLVAPAHALRGREIKRVAAQRLRNRFTSADLVLRGKGPLWVNELEWTRKRMVMDELLEGVLSAGFGVWKATRKGIAKARSLVG